MSDGSIQPLPVSFSATGGTITSGGLFTAGATEGTFGVIASEPGGLADTAAIVISAAPPTLAAIEVTPPSITLVANATQQFSAVGRLSNGGTSSVQVSWTATGGAITSGGLYTAGSAAGTFRVIATQQGGTRADTSSITITAPPPTPPTLTAVVLTPASVSLQTGATQQFSAVGQMSDGSTQSVAVTWSATGGTVTSGGLYTAGGTAGTFRVIATQQGGSRADTSSITITAPPPTLVAVELTPASVSLQTGATQQFSAVGRRSDGSTQGVTASFSATGGTVTSGGLYTAGSTAGTYRVIASASGFADTSSITVTAPAPTLVAVELTPASVNLSAGATQQFTAVGRRSDGSTQSVTPTYTATGGTVTSGGLYTAGSTAGTFRVIASASGFADTSSVTITVAAPTLVAVELTPASVSLQGGATQQFSTVGRRSDGSTQSVTPTYTATGGTITSGGLYTAGSTAGTFRVISAASGFADTSTITISVTAPTLVAVELTPASVSLQTGATQQFSAIGRLSNGGTQSVTPTWTATGGTVTSGGSYTAGSTAGSFRVIAAASGFADTSSITVTSSGGGGFAPPDLVTVNFDTPGDDAKFTVLGVSFPASWHTADATGGRNGSRAMRVQLSTGPLFEPVGVAWTPRSRVFYRWYFRTQGTPGGNVKGVIVRSASSGEKLGDFYGGAPCWSFDREGEAICFDIGLSYTQATANGPALANGQWHSIEVDYDRNAGSNVEARIWVDGNAVVLPNGPAQWGCCPYPGVQYVGGDRASNTPTTIRTARQGSNTFGELTFWETISQGVNGVSIWIDDIAVSTQRIGP